VEVPGTVDRFQQAVVGDEKVVSFGQAPPGQDMVPGLEVTQRRQPQLLQSPDVGPHLGFPLLVQLVPVGVVVPDPDLELLGPAGDLGLVGHPVGAHVDVPVDYPNVDAERRWEGEHSRVHHTCAHERLVAGDDVERGHGLGEVHAVAEPGATGVAIPARFVEQVVVGVEVTPSLGPFRGADLVGIGEPALAVPMICGRLGCCHRSPLSIRS
jgi:hypothetical protein